VATSGTQLTRIGASISGVGIKLVITAKAATVFVATSGGMLAAKHVRRAMRRGRR